MEDRELDALVAFNVMGYGSKSCLRRPEQRWICRCGSCDPIEQYSTDIASAFQVEERIYSDLSLAIPYLSELREIVQRQEGIGSGSWLSEWKMVHATPRQRCLAALKAVGVEVPRG